MPAHSRLLPLAILTFTGAALLAQPMAPSQGEVLPADTPRTTVAGHTFIAPAGWRIDVRGPATILEAPEGNSRIALVDVQAEDADRAVAAAWAAYRPDAEWPLLVTHDLPDKDGWTAVRTYEYRTSPNEKRWVSASARRAGGTWTVAIYDMDQAVGERRGAQVALIFGRLFPKGYEHESFAGKRPHPLDAARIRALTAFVQEGRRKLGIPGVSFGVVQDGTVVFAGGVGSRGLGAREGPDGDTLFMVASNTKALTTLMLAKLLEEGKLAWETPAAKLLPSFRLGDAQTTGRVLVKHLICACTGMPPQDFEWLFEFGDFTPRKALDTLATMQPTTKFGELYQYSNLMAAAAGFIGGHVAFPDLELGAAYDRAMQTRVFDPLGMAETTFDFERAQSRPHAAAHAPDIEGRPTRAVMEVNYAVIPVRPAGGAWSSVRDMLKYVQMELDEGRLPDGTRYLSRETLLARRAPQVRIGQDVTYGMGLMVDTEYGTPVVHHGGDLIGHHSDMMWLPEHGVGAVVLTNGDPGWILRDQFKRKLLEVLFDGRAEADADLEAQGRNYQASIAAQRKLMTIPADAAAAGKLAARYRNAALGEIAVRRDGGATVFDFGEWRSEMASRRNPDGTTSFLTLAPGVIGFELVVGSGDPPALIARAAQHEYVFEAAAAPSSR